MKNSLEKQDTKRTYFHPWLSLQLIFLLVLPIQTYTYIYIHDFTDRVSYLKTEIPVKQMRYKVIIPELSAVHHVTP